MRHNRQVSLHLLYFFRLPFPLVPVCDLAFPLGAFPLPPLSFFLSFCSPLSFSPSPVPSRLIPSIMLAACIPSFSPFPPPSPKRRITPSHSCRFHKASSPLSPPVANRKGELEVVPRYKMEGRLESPQDPSSTRKDYMYQTRKRTKDFEEM